MKLLIMQFPSISRHIIPPRSKYSPQTPSVGVPPLMLETKFRTHKSHPTNNRLIIEQLLGNFPAFYGARRFITVLTRALHWSLS
jgi:hypothetical protein